GHLSNRAAAELLCEVCHEGLMLVVLAHLSRRCNAEAAALATVREALGKLGWMGELCAATQEGPARVFGVGRVGASPAPSPSSPLPTPPEPAVPRLRQAVE